MSKNILRQLSDVGELIRGISFKSSDKLKSHENGHVMCLRTANIQKQIDYSDVWYIPKKYVKKPAKYLKDGDIVISSANSKELVGKCVIYRSDNGEKITFGAFLTVLRLNVKIADPNYIFLMMNSPNVKSEMLALSKITTNIANLSNKALEKVRIPLPVIEEQEFIASRASILITKNEHGLERLRQISTEIGQYKDSILSSAIRGKLVPQNPNDEPTSELLKRIAAEKEALVEAKKIRTEKTLRCIDPDELPFELPDGWSWVRLGDVITLKNGYAFKSQYFKKDRGTFVLTTPGSFYEEGGFRDQGKKTKYYDGPVGEDFILKPGDLLTVMTEQAAGLLGSAAFIPSDSKRYIHNQRLAKISPILNGSLHLDYICLYFNAPFLRYHLASTCSGSTVRHTSPKKILNVPFAMPPVSQQLRIVEKVTALLSKQKKICLVLDETAKLCSAMKQSTLKSAFEGSLT